MARPRVLLAEDHPPVAAQLRALLEQEFEVVATVADGHTLVSTAETVRPDVVVTDIAMPGLDGLAATTVLRERHAEIPVILITIHDDPEVVRAAIEAGALGYVLKQDAPEHLLAAIHRALRGERYISRPPEDAEGA